MRKIMVSILIGILVAMGAIAWKTATFIQNQAEQIGTLKANLASKTSRCDGLEAIIESERKSIDRAIQVADSIKEARGWVTLEATDRIIQLQKEWERQSDSLLYSLRDVEVLYDLP